jgi:hypothetical protein
MAVLIINRSDSRCSECGKAADLREKNHDTELGWGEQRKGCGAGFEATATEYDGLSIQQAIVELRQDLPFIGVGFWNGKNFIVNGEVR